MADLSDLEKRIEKIEARNKEKEADKAWETSLFRRILLAIFTYLVIGFFMNFAGINNPWISAIVPSIGFILSTLTLGWFKQLWCKYFYK